LEAFLRLLIPGSIGAIVLMLVLYAVAVRTANASWVDFGWTACLGLLGAGFALFGDGSPAQRLLAGGLASVWSVRLCTHLLAQRLRGQPEDGRYRAMREHFGANADRHFLWFFLVQALLAAALSWPFLAIAMDSRPGYHPVQVVAILVYLVGLAGESLADAQLDHFRRDPQNRGRTCRSGLWRYSRHPNYFFEWLIWCAFALAASASPFGLWSWLCALVMLVFVTKVTGIPYAEAQALRSRGDDYRRYQATTSAFFPWPPKPLPSNAEPG
jgi:steroid 5-alpha reductase family enzyme